MQNQVAFITGAAKRVGAVIARTLHQQGMRVVIHYSSSAAEAEKLSRELNAIRPNSVKLLQADLSDMNAIPLLAEQAYQAFHRLDILINNASSFYPSKI